MIGVRDAVARASEFVATMYRDEGFENPQLEEVELSQDESRWLVTVSFTRPRHVGEEVRELQNLGMLRPQYEREYKLVTLRAADGVVESMKIRQLTS